MPGARSLIRLRSTVAARVMDAVALAGQPVTLTSRTLSSTSISSTRSGLRKLSRLLKNPVAPTSDSVAPSRRYRISSLPPRTSRRRSCPRSLLPTQRSERMVAAVVQSSYVASPSAFAATGLTPSTRIAASSINVP